MFLWSIQTRVSVAAEQTKITQKNAIDWYNFFRDVCAEYFVNHPVTLGGPGKVVEIDESKFGKRKEFLWRKRFDNKMLFEKLLEHIADQYPL